MKIQQRILVMTLLAALALPAGSSAHAANVQGSSCIKVGAAKTVKNISYICIKSGKKLIWKQSTTKKSAPAPKLPAPESTPTVISGPTPSASPTATPAPTPAPSQTATSASFIKLYTGGAGVPVVTPKKVSAELPNGLSPFVNDDNLKLWLYDPENPKEPLHTDGIFILKPDGIWHYVQSYSVNGLMTVNIEPGTFTFDVIEPGGDSKKYDRGRYSIVVAANGALTMDGYLPNSAGYYAVTAPLKVKAENLPAAHFKPTSACQLLDQTGSRTMSNGFPRAEGRLTSSGVIRALIIPVDFSDVAGKISPQETFNHMAQGTHDFYYKESQHRVDFQFTTFADWQHLNIPVDTFKLGSYNHGDSGGFFKAGLTAADPIVDFTQFDVVYVLPPSTVKGTQIAYGPAFPMLHPGEGFKTNDGPVFNGAVGGADAWQELEGADWKWLSHETGHLFGLSDWYTLTNKDPFGPWDIMSLNWTTEAIELNSWNRYITGWLSDDQIQCQTKSALTTAGLDLSVETLEIDSTKSKAIMVKISETIVLVMEVRATAGLDSLDSERTGLLVYAVDVTVPTIQGVAKTYPRDGNGATLLRAPLKAGDAITAQGVKIRVDSFANNIATVHISS